MKDIGYEIIGAAMEVHNVLGPGLLENAYRLALLHELKSRGFNVKSEVMIDIAYKGVIIPNAYRADLIVEDRVIVELKAVTEFKPVFHMQLLTYLKLTGLKLGFLINFNTKSLVYGESYFRYVNNY